MSIRVRFGRCAQASVRKITDLHTHGFRSTGPARNNQLSDAIQVFFDGIL
jgi:hypothetical protein